MLNDVLKHFLIADVEENHLLSGVKDELQQMLMTHDEAHNVTGIQSMCLIEIMCNSVLTYMCTGNCVLIKAHVIVTLCQHLIFSTMVVHTVSAHLHVLDILNLSLWSLTYFLMFNVFYLFCLLHFCVHHEVL